MEVKRYLEHKEMKKSLLIYTKVGKYKLVINKLSEYHRY